MNNKTFKILLDGISYTYDPVSNLVSYTNNKVLLSETCNNTNVNKSNTKIVFVELTKKCNLQCKYCYIKTNEGLHDDCLAQDHKFNALCSKIVQIQSNYDDIQIVFYGGEPLIEFDLMKRIVEYLDPGLLKGRLVKYSIMTNGTLLNEDIANFLIDKKFLVAISIDGNAETMLENRGVRSMDRIEYFAKRLHEANLSVSATMAITGSNCATFGDNLGHLLQLPISLIKIAPCDSLCSELSLTSSQAKKISAELRKIVCGLLLEKDYTKLRKLNDIMLAVRKIATNEKVDRYCGYGKDVFAISSNGDLYPCPSFLGKENFKIIEYKVRFPGKSSSLKCDNCIAYSTCHGNCQYSNYVANQSEHDSMEGRCIINREIARLALSLYVKLYFQEVQ